MKKYKLNKDYVEKAPTEQETESFKDFGQLTHAYDNVVKRPKKPLYKNPKAFLGLLLIILITWLVFEEVRKERDKSEQIDTEQTDTEMTNDIVKD
jgi:hypothetical protein